MYEVQLTQKSKQAHFMAFCWLTPFALSTWIGFEIFFEIMQIVRFEIRLDFACENSLNNSKLANILWNYVGKKFQLFTVSSVAVHELQLTRKSHSKQIFQLSVG